jgi:hypothetical protein
MNQHPERQKSVFVPTLSVRTVETEEQQLQIDGLMVQVQELTDKKALLEQELQLCEIEKKNLLSSAVLLKQELVVLAASKEQFLKELQTLDFSRHE